MAEIKGGPLGKFSGAVGSITGRIRHGKNIIAAKPSSYTQPMDEESILRRDKFKCDALFSKTITNLDDLKYFWNHKIVGDMNAFNLVLQTNYKFLVNNCPSSGNIIVPPLGFPIASVSMELTASSLNVTLAAIGNADLFNPEIDHSIKLYSVIYLSSPVDAEQDPYYFISLESAKATFQTTGELTFTIPLNAAEVPVLAKYSAKHFYAAAGTLDENELPQKYSITLYK
jgi:hypothetical protein